MIEENTAVNQNTEEHKQPHKVVINGGYGGFHLSDKAIKYLEQQPEIKALRQTGELDGRSLDNYFTYKGTRAYRGNRHNPALVRCVETLGKEAGENLKVETVYGNKYLINSDDGMESLVTPDSIPWVNIEETKNSGEKEKIYTADDLKFVPAMRTLQDPRTGETFEALKKQALMIFDNGFGIAVSKGSGDRYSVKIFDEDGLNTSTDISSSGIKRVVGKDMLDEVLKDVQNLDTNGHVMNREPGKRDNRRTFKPSGIERD